MNLKKLALFVILADFVAYTVWVVASGGGVAEVIAAFSQPDEAVVSICEPPFEWILSRLGESVITEAVPAPL